MNRHRGISMIELLVTLALLLTGLVFMTTGWANFIARQNVTAATNGIIGLIHEGRSHGFSHGGAYLCDGRQGCLAFGWTNALQLGTSAEPDSLPLQRLILPRGTAVIWRGFRGQALYYGPRGHTLFQNGHFLICHQRTHITPRKVVVNWVGRPRMEEGLPDDCSDAVFFN